MGARKNSSAGAVGTFLIAGTLFLFAARVSGQQGTDSGAAKPDGSKSPAKLPPPAQPVPFSHRAHAALQLQCKFCHPNPEPGNEMTIPVAAKCMSCHTSIAKDKPSIKELTEFTRTHDTIPWARVYAVPAFVFWSHRTHLEAKMKCEACHGGVAQMDITAKVTNVTTMGGCVECHKQENASTGCAVCHEPLSSRIWQRESTRL